MVAQASTPAAAARRRATPRRADRPEDGPPGGLGSWATWTPGGSSSSAASCSPSRSPPPSSRGASGSPAWSPSSAWAWRRVRGPRRPGLRRLRARPDDRDRRPRAHPLRGRAGRELGRGAPGHRRRALARGGRDDPHGAADRSGRLRALRPHPPAGFLLGRSSPAPTARRSSRCCAARRCAGAWPGRSRARPASTTRWPSSSSWGSSTGSRIPATAWPTWRCSSSRSSPSASSSASPSARGDVGAAPRPAGLRRALPARLAGGRRAGLRRRRRRPRLRLPRRLPVRHGPGQLRHPGAPDDRDLPRRDGLARAARHVLHARPARVPQPTSTTSPSRARCSPSSRPPSPARWRCSWRCPFGGYSVPDRLVLGWAGLRGAVPVVLATFPVIAGVDSGIDVFDIVFFAVW